MQTNYSAPTHSLLYCYSCRKHCSFLCSWFLIILILQFQDDS